MANRNAFILTWAVASFGLWGVRKAPADELLFDRDVRPILKVHCFHCHGEEPELSGELDVRLRRLLLAGGDSGPAIDPGHSESSLLLQRIASGEMPPEDVEKRVSDEEIEILRRWIDEGAKVEKPEPESLPPGAWISPAEREFWSFQPIRRPPLPSVKDAAAAKQPVDLFLLAQLEEQSRGFSPAASRAAWLRRLSFDLTGLPPTPDQVRAFQDDARRGAYRRQVDRLLSSPAFGERWGRFWLDLAGYADSEGRVKDPVRPEAWRYRDYVIRSFNRGTPYDQFVLQQLAGDHFVSPPYSELSAAQQENLIATGFLRMAADGSASGLNTPDDHNQVVADTLQIVGTTLLGLTVHCAQCHNHRYDPLPQADYYRMRAVFDSALNWKQWKTPPQRRVSLYSQDDKRRAAEIEKQATAIDAERLAKQKAHIARVLKQELAKLPEAIRAAARDAAETPAAKRTAEQKKLIGKHPSINVTSSSLYLYDRKAADELKAMAKKAAGLRATKPKEQFLRALVEPAAEPPESFVFIRGDFQQPGEPVGPAGFRVLGGADLFAASNDSGSGESANDASDAIGERRLHYARWLVSGRHPLTARVAVNRLWQQLFGRGIVETPGDFGQLGARPTHPLLLDFLASELQDNGWEVKPLIRQLVLSAAYRQTARTPPDPQDPENRLLGRMPLRRLDAEAVRDAMLSAAGSLNRQAGGPAVPVMADRVGQFVIGKENLNAGRPGAVIPMQGQEYRRSVYIQVRRSRPLAVLDTFDLPAMAPNCQCRTTSTVAPQSLLLMNSDFSLRVAKVFAKSVIADVGSDLRKQAEAAWRRAYVATPSAVELDGMVDYLNTQTEAVLAQQPAKKQDRSAAQTEALATLCQALLGSNRFLYVD